MFHKEIEIKNEMLCNGLKVMECYVMSKIKLNLLPGDVPVVTDVDVLDKRLKI